MDNQKHPEVDDVLDDLGTLVLLMKKGLSDSYQAMSASWENAKSEYDTDNK